MKNILLDKGGIRIIKLVATQRAGGVKYAPLSASSPESRIARIENGWHL